MDKPKLTLRMIKNRPLEERLKYFFDNYSKSNVEELQDAVDTITNLKINYSNLKPLNRDTRNLLENYYTNIDYLPYLTAFLKVVKPKETRGYIKKEDFYQVNKQIEIYPNYFYIDGKLFNSVKEYLFETNQESFYYYKKEINGIDWVDYLSKPLLIMYADFIKEYSRPIVTDKYIFKNGTELREKFNYHSYAQNNVPFEFMNLFSYDELEQGINYLKSKLKKNIEFWYKDRYFKSMGEFFKEYKLSIPLSLAQELYTNGYTIDEILNYKRVKKEGVKIKVDGVLYDSVRDASVHSRIRGNFHKGIYDSVRKLVDSDIIKDKLNTQMYFDIGVYYLDVLGIENIPVYKPFEGRGGSKYTDDYSEVLDALGLTKSIFNNIKSLIYAGYNKDLSKYHYKTSWTKRDIYNILLQHEKKITTKIVVSKDKGVLMVVNKKDEIDKDKYIDYYQGIELPLDLKQSIEKDLDDSEIILYSKIHAVTDYLYFKGIPIKEDYTKNLRKSMKRNPYLFKLMEQDGLVSEDKLETASKKSKKFNKISSEKKELVKKQKLNNHGEEITNSQNSKTIQVSWKYCVDVIAKNKLPMDVRRLRKVYQQNGSIDIPVELILKRLKASEKFVYNGENYLNIFDFGWSRNIHPEFLIYCYKKVKKLGNTNVTLVELVENIDKYYRKLGVILEPHVTKPVECISNGEQLLATSENFKERSLTSHSVTFRDINKYLTKVKVSDIIALISAYDINKKIGMVSIVKNIKTDLIYFIHKSQSLTFNEKYVNVEDNDIKNILDNILYPTVSLIDYLVMEIIR